MWFNLAGNCLRVRSVSLWPTVMSVKWATVITRPALCTLWKPVFKGKLNLFIYTLFVIFTTFQNINFRMNCIWIASFKAFMAVIQVEVFWVVTPCSVVVGYQRFGGPCCLHLHWVVTSCSVVVGYQRFGGPCCLHLHWVVTPYNVGKGFSTYWWPHVCLFGPKTLLIHSRNFGHYHACSLHLKLYYEH
jgi:hypothetical protein